MSKRGGELLKAVGAATSVEEARANVRRQFAVDEVATEYLVDLPLRILVGPGTAARAEEIAALKVVLGA